MENGNFRLDMAEESADFLKIDVKTAQKRVGENVTVRVTCVQKDEESRALNRDKGKYITVDAEKNVAYPSVKRDGGGKGRNPNSFVKGVQRKTARSRGGARQQIRRGGRDTTENRRQYRNRREDRNVCDFDGYLRDDGA